MAQYGSGYNSSYSGGRGPSNRGGYGGNRGYDNRQGSNPAPARPHVPLDSKGYVDAAEEVIKDLGKKRLSTSKIRNLLTMISSLYDEVRRIRANELRDVDQSQIQYLRLHFAYEAGRDKYVKAFVERADIFAHIRDIGDNKEKFLLFCKYMEALVAFHRFYDGKEL